MYTVTYESSRSRCYLSMLARLIKRYIGIDAVCSVPIAILAQSSADVRTCSQYTILTWNQFNM